MRIAAFSVENSRNVRQAKCEVVPPVMLITGPNGCGKSTLLYHLRNVNGEHEILYVGPHRSSRRQSVRMRFLLQNKITMSSILSTRKLYPVSKASTYLTAREMLGTLTRLVVI